MTDGSSILSQRGWTWILVYSGIAAVTAATGDAQTASLVRITQPLQISCTAPLAKLNAGTIYVNTCTVTSGSPPFSFSVGGLPRGLTPVKASNSITVSGRLPAGHYQYVITYSGAGYSTAIGAYSVDMAPVGTYPSGSGVIRCLQKGSSSGPDAPLCQTCVISSTGRICDLDDNFRKTGKQPQAPAGACVTSVYLNYAPVTYNVDSYALSVSHKDASAVTKQIAYQTYGGNPSFATQNTPAIDFNWQQVEADGGRWSFNFLPVMQNPLPGLEWAVDFQYNIDWQVVPNPLATAAPLSSTAAETGTVPGEKMSGITADVSGSILASLDAVAVAGSVFTGWDVIAAGDLTGDGVPGILVQNKTSGALGIWQVSQMHIGAKLAIGTIPASGWRAVGAADMNGDGVPDILLQNEGSGAIEVWQMSGQDVLARTQLSAAVMPGWNVRAASNLRGGGAEIVLQDEANGDVTAWLLSNGDVTAKSDLQPAPEPGMRVVALADVTGDRVPDLVLQSKDRKTIDIWQISDLQVVAKSSLATKQAMGAAVAAADLNGTGQAGILTENGGSGVILFSQTIGH